jgi:hypothetical protein
MQNDGRQPQPKRFSPEEIDLLAGQAGEQMRLRLTHANAQIDAKVITGKARISDQKLALSVTHAEQFARAQMKHNNMRFDLDLQFRTELATLQKQQEQEMLALEPPQKV